MNIENPETKKSKIFWAENQTAIKSALEGTRDPDLKARKIAELKASYFLSRFNIPVGEDEERFFTHSGRWEDVVDIIREGIISESFARRIGKEGYKTNHPQSKKDDVDVSYSFVKPWRKSQPVFIVDSHSDLYYPEQSLGGEMAVKRRVSPREILALILPESEEHIEKLDLDRIKSFFEANPDKAIPIFIYSDEQEQVLDPDDKGEYGFYRIKVGKRLYP